MINVQSDEAKLRTRGLEIPDYCFRRAGLIATRCLRSAHPFTTGNAHLLRAQDTSRDWVGAKVNQSRAVSPWEVLCESPPSDDQEGHGKLPRDGTNIRGSNSQQQGTALHFPGVECDLEQCYGAPISQRSPAGREGNTLPPEVGVFQRQGQGGTWSRRQPDFHTLSKHLLSHRPVISPSSALSQK
eukprot:2392801-Rhodomonas_salina.1